MFTFNPQASKRSSLLRWQTATALTLLVGYGGYYVCRSNFSVVAPLIVAEGTLDKEAIGLIGSIGVLVYALGKLAGGVLADFLGGRRMFLAGMAGSVTCTLAFGFGTGLTVFVAAWSLNRLFQSMGWPGLMKISARWFPAARHGTILGVISLSYLFGDAASRFILGGYILLEFSWRDVFYKAALILTALSLAAWLVLRDSPRDIGAEEPSTNPDNVFGQRGEEPRPEGLVELLVPFLISPSFWLVCGMSFGMTLIREAFNLWTPLYLAEAGGETAGRAAIASLVFPLVGGFSVLVMGALSDLFGTAGRGKLLAPAALLTAIGLVVLARLGQQHGLTLRLLLLAAVSFLMIGPYSLLAGVMALDLGGKRGGATASGMIDSAGYLGAVLSGWGIGWLAENNGWQTALYALAAVALATAGVGAAYAMSRRTLSSNATV